MLCHKGTKELETSRLLLRRFTLSDEREVFEHFTSDPEVARYLSWKAHSTQKVTHDLLETWCRHYYLNTYNWAILLKESNEVIGSAAIGKINDEKQSGEIAYALSQKEWGKGIITEAMNRIFHFCFVEVGFQELIGLLHEDNIASRRVMEKLGMQFVQKISQGYYDHNNRPCTVLKFSARYRENSYRW